MNAPDALLDVSDMYSIHQVFRDALHSAPTLLASTDDGDTARSGVVGAYYRNVLALLHGHHDGEDLLMTPRLLERAPESAGELARIASQHREVDAALAEAEAALAAWEPQPTGAARDRLGAALGELDARLEPHLAEEERVVLPIAAAHLTPPEWGELPEHGFGHFAGDRIWLILGLIRDQLSPAHLAEMDAHLPPPVAELWADEWETTYRAFLADLHGAPVPG